MNPERTRSVSSLMQIGLIVSSAIIVVFFVGLGLASLYISDHTIMILAVSACAIIVLIGVIAVNYYVQRWIREQFISLANICRDYTSGDRGVRAPVSGDDEFALLATSLNNLLDGSGGSMSGMGASLGSAGGDAAALQAQIEKLLQEVSAVGDGDLRVQAEVTPDTLGVLADSFNYMIEELAKVVGRVQSTAVQVTNATRRILDRSADLAQATETQVSQISQTSEAVEALAIFIQNVARNAQLSVEAAQDALRNAANGQQAVRQTIEGMMLIRENVQETSKKIKRLGERSNEIGEIVRIIEDIADQTNLLALNAAIQSAMAGEHGRGFAVVADEIRVLAERSTESTKRIATLVKSIQGDTYEAVVAMEDSTQEVVKGSQLADDAGRSLNSIYGAVERQAQMIESIARAANEQTSVSEAVAVAMSQISEITRQTDAGTQEAAVSVSYLAELSEQLRASVSTFRLPDRNGEGMGSFQPMGGMPELSEGPHNGAFAAMGGNESNDWNQGFSNPGFPTQGFPGQGFSGNFPPLPEPGNSGSLVALTAQAGQYNLGPAQQNGGSLPGFGSQQGLGNQISFGDQPQFGQVSGGLGGGQVSGGLGGGQFGGAGQLGGGQFGGGLGGGQFGNPASFGGNNFGSQSSFGDAAGFDAQQVFGGNGFGSQNYQSMPGFGGQPNQQQGFGGQPSQQQGFGGQPSQQQGFGGQPNQQGPYQGIGNANSGALPPAPGQGPQGAPRPRWQNGGQQGQGGQLSYNQDQVPFPHNNG
ncbi:MAG TPA: methyl-accepting chemotaxis protein [Ktedonobacteraceae bacterium]|nr:methyl-accepting chemotaxis protein [Ktedonobacteraceae bacterium]